MARAPRRALVAAGLALTMLAGCAAAPRRRGAAPPLTEEARAAALRALGFKRTDEGWTFDLLGTLLFEVDDDNLGSEHREVAERLGRGLAELGVERLRTEGHSDDVGSDSYNVALSLRRAQAVARVLLACGLDEARIDTVGLGRAAPIADNSTAEGRIQNRRVAVIIPIP